MTVIVELDSGTAEALTSAVGGNTTVVAGLEQVRRHLDTHPGEYAVILGSSVDLAAGVALADTLRVTKPALGVILVRRRVDTTVLAEALRPGCARSSKSATSPDWPRPSRGSTRCTSR